MADWLSPVTWLIDKIIEAIKGNKHSVKLCVRLISTPESELTDKEYRIKTSPSDYGLEIYNMGEKPYILDRFSISHRNGLWIDCFPDQEGITIQPYQKIVYTLMEQEARSLEYHCKIAKFDKCKVYVYDITGKRYTTKLDVSSITFMMSLHYERPVV